jgi:hypothetical protein
MKRTSIIGVFTVLLISFFVATTGIGAQTTAPTRTVRPTRVVGSIPPQARSCDVLQDKMSDNLLRYEERQKVVLEKYKNTITLTTSLLSSLDAQGRDTTQARTDLAIFSTKVTKFETDFTTFATKMREAINLPCRSMQTYLAKINEARALLRIVRNDNADVVKFYNSVLRGDLIALRNKPELSGRPISPRPSITHKNPTRKPRVTEPVR